MTDGTSQGLFIVVAIVIFGIFVVLAYILFEDTLSPAMVSMFNEATQQARINLNYSKNYVLREDSRFDSYDEVDFVWDEVNGKYTPNVKFKDYGWSRGYNSGVENPGIGYHAHVNIDKFGQPVLAFINQNNRWLGVSYGWEADSDFAQDLNSDSVVEVSFDMWSYTEGAAISGGFFQPVTVDDNNRHGMIPDTERIYESGTKKDSWERMSMTFKMSEYFNDEKDIYLYIYGHGTDTGTSKYIDNVEVRIVR